MMDDLNPIQPLGSGAINPFAMPTTSTVPSAVSNPFFDSAPASSSNPSAVASNPFLMDDVEVPSQPVYNPFAASVSESSTQPVGDHVDSLAWLNSGGAMQLQDHMVSPYDLPDASHHHQLMDDLLEVDVPLPDELVSGHIGIATPSPMASPLPESVIAKPGRPTPPPRPPSRPSPPHETQQLILSVTGAMQATSEHLLDRLRAAAPSPVPGYHPPTMHSHSPSPSPSPCASPTHSGEVNLLHDSDHLSGPPPRPTSRPASPAVPQRPQQPPTRPSPHGPPPRPSALPGASPAHQATSTSSSNKGFASIFGEPSPASELETLAFSTPANSLVNPAKVEEPAEEIDLLGLPKPRTRTNNDILKLFEKKEEKEKDLLAEDVFDGGFLVDLHQQAPTCPIVPEASYVLAASNAFHTEEPVTQPTVVEEEPAVQQTPTLVYPEKSPIQSEPIAIPSREGQSMEQSEDFDAFSSRFESVGREDTLMVESDPFDPFSAGGSAKGSSGKSRVLLIIQEATAINLKAIFPFQVWGTATGTPESSSLLGFGASEGFDPFLALTEPPPPPHGSPRFPPTSHHQLSHDSDEEQPEFALSIKSVDHFFIGTI